MNLVLMLKKEMCAFCSKFSVKCEVSHKNIVKVYFLMLVSNRESWHLQAGITLDYNCM